jgi:hypothetical protein
VARLENELSVARQNQPPALTDAQRAEMLALGTELPRLWNHPAATAATRKRILRAVLEEIIVTVGSDRLQLKLHWKGGDHTALEVPKNRPGQHRWKTNETTEQLICDLARQVSDQTLRQLLIDLVFGQQKAIPGHSNASPYSATIITSRFTAAVSAQNVAN